MRRMPMKVLIVEPGKYPREADIEHTLEAEQAVVGGTIEAVYPWRDSACIVCNDNGIAAVSYTHLIWMTMR